MRFPQIVIGRRRERVLYEGRFSASGPSLRRMAIIGHQFVRPDWSRFRPTNAVNQYQFSFTHRPKASESNTKNPAIKRNGRSTFIFHLNARSLRIRAEITSSR